MKRKRKRKLKKQFKVLLITIPVIVCLVLLIIYAFQLKTVKVNLDLNQYTEKEVQTYIKSKEIDNTLLFWIKNKLGKSEKLDMFETYSVKINSPFKVTLDAYEKRLKGYILKDDLRYYFNDEGIILKITAEKISGVPKVTGIEYNKLELYKKIDAKNNESLKRLLVVCDAISDYEFAVKRIDILEKQETTLYIKKVKIMLGNDNNLNKKLQTLNDMYSNVIKAKGTLNMKHLNQEGVYTLKKEEETTKKKNPEKETTTKK